MTCDESTPIQDWPSIRDAAETLHMATPSVWRLIQTNHLEAARTRLGYLVDPRSVAAYAEQRHARGHAVAR